MTSCKYSKGTGLTNGGLVCATFSIIVFSPISHVPVATMQFNILQLLHTAITAHYCAMNVSRRKLLSFMYRVNLFLKFELYKEYT